MPIVEGLPVAPQPTPPENNGEGFGRRKLLVGIAAGGVVVTLGGAFAGLRALSGGETPAPVATTDGPSPTPTEAAPTTEPTPSESPTPDEGAPTAELSPNAVNLADLDSRANTDTDGSAEHFVINGQTGEDKQALFGQASALRANLDAGFPSGTTFLRFGPNVDQDAPDQGVLNTYFSGMANAGIDKAAWGHVVIDATDAKPARMPNVVRRTGEALQATAPDTSASMLVQVDGPDKSFASTVTALKTNKDMIRAAKLDAITVRGTGDSQERIRFNGKDGGANLSGILDPARIKQLSDATGIKNVRIDTTIPSTDPNRGIVYSDEERDKIAHGIAGVAEELMRDGLSVAGVSITAGVDHARETGFPVGHEQSYTTLHDRLNAIDPTIKLSANVTPYN